MNILTVHNYYQLGGGEDTSHTAEMKLLRSRGHLVDEYVEDNHRIQELGLGRVSLRTIWSMETYRRIRDLLNRRHYDVILVHNYFPLVSPSLYYAAAKTKTPLIQFIHNYRLVCLNAYLFRDGKPCEDCIRTFFPLPGFLRRCYRNSRSASATVAAMLAVHRMLKTWERKVARYITLTEFASQKLIEGGIPAEKIAVRANFVYPDPGEGSGDGSYYVYVGRFSAEKGVNTMLEAWQQLPDTLQLKMIGTGELVEKAIRISEKMRNIEVVGALPQDEVLKILKEGKALIFPSLLYEGMPRTILEAFAAGTPVIASDRGAMSRMIQPGENGYLFSAGNSRELAERVAALENAPESYPSMRRAARRQFEEKYGAEQAYQALIEIVLGVMDESSGRN